MNGNSLLTKAVEELLDGRFFVIPSYQRGYRWKGKQVEDLLNDLYSFATKPDRKNNEFYCLQPIIVQKVSHEDKAKYECPADKEAWEVVDGQQRLTTIYILLNYILKKRLRYDEEGFKEDYRKELFHLSYETREHSDEFFTNMDVDVAKAGNIDYSYILNAYHHIDNWFMGENGALKIYNRLPMNKRPGNSSPKGFAESILNLFINAKGSKDASVQFIWYELASGADAAHYKNAIEEFVRINNGKIALTNAELIKALFLQKKNFSTGDEDLKQIQIAMEWEQIENELHRDDFWYYIRKKESKFEEIVPSRIDYLFAIEYKARNWITVSVDEEEDAKINLKRLNEELSDKDKLFRFYNDKFDGFEDVDLYKAIKSEWNNLLNCFRTLQGWYNDSEIYNYIGYLSQCGVDMAEIYHHYVIMDTNQVRSEFISYLQDLVRRSLKSIKIIATDDPEFPNGTIGSSYKQRFEVYNALLFLNVNLLNERIVNLRATQDQKAIEAIESTINSSIYKFPFDIFVGQNWDIEHIDSYTTNPLKSIDDQIEWLNHELEGLEGSNLLDAEGKASVLQLMNDGKYKEAIDELRLSVGEDVEADEDEKNSIGNLTLLDSTTNRQYHNDLFFVKRTKIMERLKEGIFVPTTTLYAFAKLYDESGGNLTQWGHSDKVKYHNFIINSLKGYIGGANNG